mgnify:CR=1 FL=1
MRRTFFLIAAVALSACTTTTGITPIGSGLYMLGTQDGMAYSGSKVKAGLYQQAQQFCEAKNEDVMPDNSTSQDSSFAEYASAEIQFRCAARVAQGN